MGGGPSNITSSQGLPAWATNWAGWGLGGAGNLAKQYLAGGYPSGLNYQVAPLTPDQQAAFQSIEQAAPGATGIASMGTGQLGATLGGQYLSPTTNPWLAQTAQGATQGLVNQYNLSTAPSLMAEGEVAAGGGPGSLASQSGFLQSQLANQYGLGQSIGNTEANIYGGAYQAERANQMNALGLLPQTQSALFAPANALLGAGSFQQQQAQAQLEATQKNAAQQINWPWQQYQMLANIFPALTGGFSLGAQTSPYATK
jgi:hypothetical protein